jgi:transcriptional regulator with XRE-family HTH domain
MMWIDRIGECVRAAMSERGISRRDLARMAGNISLTLVDSVKSGNPSSSAKNIDAVVSALNLQVVADCIPADQEWQGSIEQRLAELRKHRTGTHGQVMDWDTKDAEELLHLVDYIIKSGKAKGAVDALVQWRAGSKPPTLNHNSGGGGSPLA